MIYGIPGFCLGSGEKFLPSAYSANFDKPLGDYQSMEALRGSACTLSLIIAFKPGARNLFAPSLIAFCRTYLVYSASILLCFALL